MAILRDAVQKARLLRMRSSKSIHCYLRRREFALHCRDEFRNGRMDLDRASKRRVGRAGVHGRRDAVDRLIAAGTENCGAENPVAWIACTDAWKG